MENENNNPNQDSDAYKDEPEETGSAKSWIQDNLRIIISIIIVVVIAAGVYSYSKRTSNPEEKDRLGITTLEDNTTAGEISSSENTSANEQNTNGTVQNQQPAQGSVVSSNAVSQETENSFIETAGKGDGLTHLARRSLANYLEKNSDSTLTPEHKIYIEDYLRKNVGFNKGVKIGTSVEFSKEMVQNAIEKSKNLNEKQLKNLHKYALRVPSLS